MYSLENSTKKKRKKFEEKKKEAFNFIEKKIEKNRLNEKIKLLALDLLWLNQINVSNPETRLRERERVYLSRMHAIVR